MKRLLLAVVLLIGGCSETADDSAVRMLSADPVIKSGNWKLYSFTDVSLVTVMLDNLHPNQLSLIKITERYGPVFYMWVPQCGKIVDCDGIRGL